MEEIAGGVTAPRGYRACGVCCGLKVSGKPDLALLVSDVPANVAGVFTTNEVKAAPVLLSRQVVARGAARAVIINAGNANCCAPRDRENAERMQAAAAAALGLSPQEVLVCSTGVIGHELPVEKIEAALPAAVSELRPEGGPGAALAIMTTDTRPKEIAVEVQLPEGSVRVGGMCKGSGMIAPNMATMLGFLTTDAAVEASTLQAMLAEIAGRTFNCVTVDSDTSTNDTLLLFANGAAPAAGAFAAGHPKREENLRLLAEAVEHVCTYLAREIARDGEGATRLVTVTVRGAANEAAADAVARTIAESPLVKTAIFGRDPNWGRILMAAGRAGVPLDPARVTVALGDVTVFRHGLAVAFDPDAARAALTADEVQIQVDLGAGEATRRVWTCDFTYDYVKINADYHT
ncbi:MAG TPA: bifunctional glutamate N-acetyltransferase/amino-acid acetyltransferase ArgJ [Armatimonadota bacterium]|nr:bifunctional glutamate N-acetyltransferase/amino-acid acetyltransferase ArgJ [Armatimonadota bacterium]HOJ20397.1 bifunctional glutamate N-acetyltransferase/amino-acid acetyltransferase ArgJ [Armatimonadota bacterium]HOM82193.1 bifunctional glutamate N-acetyltransferase/amino-acid acetyltransferase ArgJ [Armatimonadota bacterium]HPO71928.1 bifunctional glutamate N-acetyltransferase/amino-acid acetyltransferase ArgJ [Armatimonadota bacterium]